MPVSAIQASLGQSASGCRPGPGSGAANDPIMAAAFKVRAAADAPGLTQAQKSTLTSVAGDLMKIDQSLESNPAGGSPGGVQPTGGPSESGGASPASKAATPATEAFSSLPTPADAGGPAGNPGNVAGQGAVNPDKQIYVPMSGGKYDMKALDAVATQGLGGIAPVGDIRQADAAKGGDPGKSDGHKWQIANGPAAGVPYGAAITWGAYRHGYTSPDDLKTALAQPEMESGYQAGYTQNPKYVYAANTGGALGLFQLDPHWHNTENAFNPFHNADMAMGIMRSMGQGSNADGGKTDGSLAKDELVYNTGKTTDPEGQPNKLGSYHQTSETLKADLAKGDIPALLKA